MKLHTVSRVIGTKLLSKESNRDSIEEEKQLREMAVRKGVKKKEAY